jgi:hypothetical protein
MLAIIPIAALADNCSRPSRPELHALRALEHRGAPALST